MTALASRWPRRRRRPTGWSAAVLADLRPGADQGVVVDSPPGAGKSTLVVRAAADAGRAPASR